MRRYYDIILNLKKAVKIMSKSNVKTLGIIAVSILLYALCGCAETPDMEAENGIRYAVEESDENIQSIVEEETDEEDAFLAEVMDGNRCVCSIGNSDYVISIDAEVTGLDVATVSAKTAVPDPDAINRDKVIELFFGGEENVTETYPEEENSSAQENSGEIGIISQMNSSGGMFLDSADGKIHFYQNAHAGFYYSNDELISQYKQIDTRGSFSEEQDKDISDSYTVSMAEQDLLETLSQILNEEVQILSCKSTYNEAGNGYYEFIFAPMIDGLQVAINDYSSNADSIVDVYGRAQIGEDGIALIEASNFLWKSSGASEEKEVLSFGKILKLLEQYMNDGKIMGSEKYTFTMVSLAWLPVTEDWTEAELVPVWRFYIPIEELIELEYVENAPSDICINAVTGEIERWE